jgi:hypothetical protein
MSSDDRDFRKKQQDLTELNSDGNRQRGRYGEDESHLKPEEDGKKDTETR